MALQIPTYTLNDGITVPQVGFGTYPLKGEDGAWAVHSAITTGYRLIDTAVNYQNEGAVGEGIRRSGVARERIQVATKIPGRFHAYDDAIACVQESSWRLGVDYIDLALIHWPNPSVDKYSEAWRALVQLQKDGLVRSIGVSNFTEEHLRRIIDETGVTPAVNQVELHPYFPQEELRLVHAELGIRTESWSPLGRAGASTEEAPVVEAAEAHGVSPSQVILRWQTQLGALPIPKSAAPARQRENLNIFGFELTETEISAITALGRPDGRLFDADPNFHEEE
ncbi:aldo/keto reductase [Lysinibacter cavernae]|uniref:Diketogulonate reductase-like aldo/keto reductase n=1 Tax=Lysinibacter cavernae TaxID=1640652 RepID=A0A7X5R0R6_9MICO|nr:aldo/keto reductase [Lysinibacter cavernae]NIH53494.1 diketogulonate reductase-like aldo/keto reductase [Lysinibacter cavernae]